MITFPFIFLIPLLSLKLEQFLHAFQHRFCRIENQCLCYQNYKLALLLNYTSLTTYSSYSFSRSPCDLFEQKIIICFDFLMCIIYLIFENQNNQSMIEEPSRHSDSQFNYSRTRSRRKDQSKLKQYETNMENYTKNEHFRLEKVDPKGLIADAVYASFSGVIESAELFLHQNEDFQINYQIIVGEEWHDETPDINDMEGISTFCEAKDGKVAFSLSFDCLLSCVYVQSWPQLVIKLKGFNWKGEMITKGYAQLHLPAESGQKVMEAYIYTVVKDLQWYHRFLPFMRPDPIGLDEKDFERIICRGEGRESQKIRSIGKLKIRGETLLRNYDKFGYR